MWIKAQFMAVNKLYQYAINPAIEDCIGESVRGDIAADAECAILVSKDAFHWCKKSFME